MDTKIRWELVKLNCIYESNTVIQRAKFGNLDVGIYALLDSIADNSSISESLDKFSKACEDVINNWDIRAAFRLIKIFPNVPLPKWVKDGNYIIDMDEAGFWCLFRR